MATDGQELIPYQEPARPALPSFRSVVEASRRNQLATPKPFCVSLGEVFQIYGEEGQNSLADNINAYMWPLIESRLNYIEKTAINLENKFDMAREILRMTFADYIEITKFPRDYQKQYNEKASEMSRAGFRGAAHLNMSFKLREYPIACWLNMAFNKRRHTPSLRGYLSYLEDSYPDVFKELKTTGVAGSVGSLDQKTREMHTYITGGSGSGKTELLKSFVFHDVSHGHAVVIIDPTGNFAGSVARWPEFAGEGAQRLVYLNPTVLAGMAPVLNPLDAAHLNPTERSILANQLTDVLAQVGETDWTPQTETVASACFQVLLNRPGSTLRDLRLALVEPDRKTGKIPPIAEELIQLGKQHPNQEVADFFEYEFLSSQYVSSKGSLRAKLAHILRDSLFQSMTTGKSTVDLARLIDQGKVIIFDLGAWGDNDAAGAFGRMVIAQLAAIGMRRRTEFNKRHTPVFVYIDEIDVFMCKAVLLFLSELRQHGMHLTAAQQTVGYNLSVNDKRQLLNNTAIKFTSGAGQKEMLQMMGAPPEASMRLRPGEFVGQWGPANEPFKLATRRDLLGKTRRMTDEELRETMLFQAKSYYTEIPDRFAVQAPQPSLATYQRVRKI